MKLIITVDTSDNEFEEADIKTLVAESRRVKRWHGCLNIEVGASLSSSRTELSRVFGIHNIENFDVKVEP